MMNNQIDQLPFDFDSYEETLQDNQKANLAKDLLQNILKDVSNTEYNNFVNAFSSDDPIESFALAQRITIDQSQKRIQQLFQRIKKSSNPQIINQILGR